MRWFIVQRLSAAVNGLTSAQFIGPFYGDTASIAPLMRLGDYILVYVNGAWTEL